MDPRFMSPIARQLRPSIHFDVVDIAQTKLFLSIFAVIGVIYTSSKIISFFRLLASLYLFPGKSTRDFGPPGSWAVVTGASDGIGKEFAKYLAVARFNVVLVSRTASKLDALAAELTTGKHAVQVKTLAMDFTRNDDADYARLAELTRDLDVAVLINNVGQSHAIPVPFLETSRDEMESIISVNCLGTLRVTQTIAPGMVTRRRGLIMTMASFGGILPTPLLATYSGSKAFLQQWSTALGAELEPEGITVQLVQSYLVTSAMSKIRKPSAFVPTPREFVVAAMDKVKRSGGAQGIAYTSTPYWAHAFMHWGIATFAGTMNKFVLKRNYDMHKQIRKRALKKAERSEKETKKVL